MDKKKKGIQTGGAGCSRRGFLAGAGASIAFPTIISAGVIGKRKGMMPPRRPAPSERLNLGVIGYGTMGYDGIGNFLYNDHVQVVAVSDPNRGVDTLYGYNGRRGGGMAPCKRRVDKFYAERAGKTAYNGCKTFFDFRDLLECGVDAVMVTTPDHWHAINSIYAMRKGKHVYCQKPLAMSIGQGLAMVKAAKETGVTFQVGSQQRSDVDFRRACEFVRNGYLGKLQRIEIGLPGGKFTAWGKSGKWVSREPLAAPPDYFGKDGWEMWQGPAPRHAFIPAINSPMSWRYNLAYGGGMITDFGAHHLDILQWALGRDGSGPVAVENIEGDMDLSDPVYNTAGRYSFEVVYADGVRAIVSNRFRHGLRFFGENGRQASVMRGRLATEPKELYRTKLKPTDTHLYVSGQHERNFVECCFSGKPTIAPCEVGHRSITISHIANIGLRLGKRSLKWDPVKERFPDCDEANKLIEQPLYNGWTLEPRA